MTKAPTGIYYDFKLFPNGLMFVSDINTDFRAFFLDLELTSFYKAPKV